MLNITYISPELLKKNDWNTNKVSSENEDKLDSSLEQYGMFKPILCREKNNQLEIIGGEHRVESAIRLGYKEIPIINLGDISDDKAKKIGLLDNGRYGSDDFSELQNLINSLENPNQLFEVLPYSVDDFQGLFQSNEINLNEIPSFDDSDEDLNPETSLSNNPSNNLATHAIVKFKIPFEFLQDFEAQIQKREQQLGLEYDDKLKNAGNALLSYVLGDSYVK